MASKDDIEDWVGHDLSTLEPEQPSDVAVAEDDDHRHIEQDRVYDTRNGQPFAHTRTGASTYGTDHATLFSTPNNRFFLYERTYNQPSLVGRLKQLGESLGLGALIGVIIGMLFGVMTLPVGIIYIEFIAQGGIIELSDTVETVALYIGWVPGILSGLGGGIYQFAKIERKLQAGLKDRQIEPFETVIDALSGCIENGLNEGAQRLISEHDIAVQDADDWVLFTVEDGFCLAQPDEQWARTFPDDEALKDYLSDNDKHDLYEALYANRLKPA